MHHDDLQAKGELGAYFLDALQPRANEAILCVVLLTFIDTKRYHRRQNNCPLLSYTSIKAFKTNHRMYRNNRRRIIIKPTIECTEIITEGSLFLKLVNWDLSLFQHHYC